MNLLKLTKTDRNNKVREVGSIEIKNQTENSAELCFFGDINSESWGKYQEYFPEDKAPSDVERFLSQLENVSNINIHINSGGGSVFGGIAIYNMLKRFNANITVYVEGLAASIASVIAMAGDKIIIPKNAQMMIHKPSSIAWGNAEDMRKEAEILDGCQKVILSTYMQHTREGVTEDEINRLINAETWKNGEEWQEYFDIEVGKSNQAVAAVSDYYEKYNNIPKDLAKKQEENVLNLDEVMTTITEAVKDCVAEMQDNEQKKLEEEKKEILKDLDYI